MSSTGSHDGDSSDVMSYWSTAPHPCTTRRVWLLFIRIQEIMSLCMPTNAVVKDLVMVSTQVNNSWSSCDA